MKARRVKKVSAKSIREKNVAKFARKTAKYAIKKATDNNVTVTVARRGHIYRIHPDGRTERLTPLPRKVKVSKHVIKLGA